ncbi:hypothetical protein EYF80_025173 [Liparis tanakae]|uniref:Uncharacterized protein n=1 Tax=Liparis tanakae TaxID=230148 RepID=A0A4Z2HFQ2_9TELE|nr:hypothetical protein EYF80_025173 [Liparis tanakae]
MVITTEQLSYGADGILPRLEDEEEEEASAIKREKFRDLLLAVAPLQELQDGRDNEQVMGPDEAYGGGILPRQLNSRGEK